MDDFFQDSIQLLEPYTIYIVPVLLVFVIIVFLGRKIIKHHWLNLKARYQLNRLGVKQISSLQCPDGLGHFFIIDRLILRHDGISLLIYKHYPGKIFCADKIDDWTQMTGMKSYRFKNPLYDLDHQIKAVSACVPGVAVEGFLFFDHQTEFPKGHPDRVIHTKNIPQHLFRDKRNEVEVPVMNAWKKLLLMADA